MLRETILTFEEADPRRIKTVAALEDEVDAAQEEIKLYLARLMQRELSRRRAPRCWRWYRHHQPRAYRRHHRQGLLRLAAKKQKQGLRFSEAGWQDIRAFHAQIAEQMRRALTVFVTRDAARRPRPRGPEGPAARRGDRASERHFARLRDGMPETIETSALHLDVLRDLKRVNAHLTRSPIRSWSRPASSAARG